MTRNRQIAKFWGLWTVLINCLLAASVAFGQIGGSAFLDEEDVLQPEELLVLYYSDPESEEPSDSMEIALHYESKYPGVHLYNLAIDPNGEATCDCDPAENEYFAYVDPPAEWDPENPLDVFDYSEKYATPLFITPRAYEDWIEAKVCCWILQHNAENDPDILAIATTRGVPSVITNHFDPCRSHNNFQVKGAVETRLAAMGLVKADEWPQNGSSCATNSPRPTNKDNEFKGKLGIGYREYLENQCLTGEAIVPGLLPLYLVTRLDAELPDADGDGFPDIPDVNGDEKVGRYDANNASRLVAVKALIDRGHDLRTGETVINSFMTTIVVDDAYKEEEDEWQLAFADKPYLDYLRYFGFCVEEDRTDAFLQGARDYEVQDCPECEDCEDCADCCAHCFDPANPFPQFTGWDENLEGLYTGDISDPQVPFATYELAHLGWGRNHYYHEGGELARAWHEMAYNASPAGFYMTLESWGGFHSRLPGYAWASDGPACGQSSTLHSQSIHWTSVGGSFTMHAVSGPTTSAFPWDTGFLLVNLYVHGLTWAEAVYSALPFTASEMVPIGDPLARVLVVNPDISNGTGVGQDGKVDNADLLQWQAWALALDDRADFDQDGDFDSDDENFIADVTSIFLSGGRTCEIVEEAPEWPEIDEGEWDHWAGEFDDNGIVDGDDLRLLMRVFNCGRVLDMKREVDGVPGWEVEDVIGLLCNWGHITGDVPGYSPCVADQDDLDAIHAIWEPEDAPVACAGCPEDIASPGIVDNEGNKIQARPVPDGVVDEWDEFAVLDSPQGVLSPCQAAGDLPNLVELIELYNMEDFFLDNDLSYDCNFNGILDACEILAEATCDDDENNIPDSCDFCDDPPAQLIGDCAPIVCETDQSGGDGSVSIADVTAVLAAYGQCPNAEIDGCACDFAPPGGDGLITIADVTAVISAYGNSCESPAQQGGDSRLALEVMDFSDGYPDETGEIIEDCAEEIGISWENFSEDWDIYRLWVEVETSTTKIEAISGDDALGETLALTTEGDFFNHANGTNFPPNAYATCNKPTLRFDTYITLGSATTGSGISLMGSLSLTSSVIETNTGWFKTGGVPPVAGGSTGWRVLIGQFAVPKGEPFTGGVHITGDGIDEYATFSSD